MAAGGKRQQGLILIGIAVILILGLLAAYFFVLRPMLTPPSAPAANNNGQTAAQPNETPMPAPGDMVEVYVVTQQIGRGNAITADYVTLVPIPKFQYNESFFFTKEKKDLLFTKRARFDLPAGVPITTELLSDAPSGSIAANLIPRGMVAISLPISRLTSVSYALQPGDHVGIISSFMLADLDTQFQSKLPNNTAMVVPPGLTPMGTATTAQGGTAAQQFTLPPSLTIGITPANSGTLGRTEMDATLNQPVYVIPAESQRPRLVSQALVSNAIVLWVGEFPSDQSALAGKPTPTPTPVPADAAQQQNAAPPPAPVKPDVVTLVVFPQDAVTLNYLMLAGGRFNLMLRNTNDDLNIKTEAVTLQFILDQYNIPLPAKLPYGMDPKVPITDPNLTLKYPNEEIKK
jgi:pilus assembly protein CpaB